MVARRLCQPQAETAQGHRDHDWEARPGDGARPPVGARSQANDKNTA